jgi:hypothetical protein
LVTMSAGSVKPLLANTIPIAVDGRRNNCERSLAMGSTSTGSA